MPSIKMKPSKILDALSKSVLAVLCTSLIACGSSNNTTRVTKEEIIPEKEDPNLFSISVRIPMEVQHAKLKIQVLGEDKPIYENNDFTGFDATVAKLSRNKYQKRIILVKLVGVDGSRMYDAINDKFVSFTGELNSIVELQATNLYLSLTPVSEAIFQRTLVRAGNLDLQKPDLSLITGKYISKSTAEVNASLNDGFNVAQFPKFNTSKSIALVTFEKNSEKNYVNTFIGLGILKLWAEQHPTLANPYLSLAQNFAIDLRDGYLDGRTLHGDNTPFIPFNEVKNTPQNTDTEKNNFNDIGKTQEAVRQAFGNKVKNATLAYAEQTFQSILNPEGMNILQKNNYYSTDYTFNNSSRFRWNGAGDYRPAFGIKNTENLNGTDNACQPQPPYPCKQGLNADDINTYYSDIEYLIGTHTVGQCKIEVFPNGNVDLTKNAQIVHGSINRDMSDNLQQIDRNNKHYVLNIGAGEKKPPYFMQLEIKNTEIVQARTGSTTSNFYPDLNQLEKIDLSCS